MRGLWHAKQCPQCKAWNNLSRTTCWRCKAPLPEKPS